MRLTKKRRRFGCEINITPLIDIVFLLIIFSMVVSQFTKVEVDELELPEAAKGETPKALPVGRIIVNLHTDGRIVVGGQAHSPQSLKDLLDAAVNQSGNENVSILIRGDRQAPWRKVAGVLRACAAKNIAKVKVAVIEPGAGTR